MGMPPLHLVTQRDQPYGSERRCCEICGLSIYAMRDYEHRATDDPETYRQDAFACTKLPESARYHAWREGAES